MSEKKAKNQPVHVVRLGSIKATIWPNETEFGTRFNVTVCRLYKEGDKWRDSMSFGRDDLLELAKTLDLTHTWIRGQEGREEPEGERAGG